jgi:outer membrane murein-binding lipoprotein Lpp
MKSKITISILLLSMFVITGCISKSLEEAQVDFCQALVAYGAAVDELQNVNVSTTVEELQSASDDAADAREDVKDAAGDLREAKLRASEDAWDNTQEAIDDISGDATLGQAATTVRGQAFILATEINKITNISCGRR